MTDDRHITITDEVAEAVCRGAGYIRNDQPITIDKTDGEAIADALHLLADIDEGDNTDTDALRRLAGVANPTLWTDPETGYEYATTEQALLEALPAVAQLLDIERESVGCECGAGPFTDEAAVQRHRDQWHGTTTAAIDADRIDNRATSDLPPPGTRVEFTKPVERYPHFIVPAGTTGMVAQFEDQIYTVRLDEPMVGAEEWNNEVVFSLLDGEDPSDCLAPSYVNRPAIKAASDDELRQIIAEGGPAEVDQAAREELGKREIAAEANKVADRIKTEQAYVEAHNRADEIFYGDWDAHGTVSVHIPNANTAGWLHERGWKLDDAGLWVAPNSLRYWDVEAAVARQLLTEILMAGEPQ